MRRDSRLGPSLNLTRLQFWTFLHILFVLNLHRMSSVGTWHLFLVLAPQPRTVTHVIMNFKDIFFSSEGIFTLTRMKLLDTWRDITWNHRDCGSGSKRAAILDHSSWGLFTIMSYYRRHWKLLWNLQMLLVNNCRHRGVLGFCWRAAPRKKGF